MGFACTILTYIQTKKKPLEYEKSSIPTEYLLELPLLPEFGRGDSFYFLECTGKITVGTQSAF